MIITTKKGDVLDLLCFNYYGTEHEVAAVLQRNPHLTKLDEQCLPAGVAIDLGDVPAPGSALPATTIAEISLWD